MPHSKNPESTPMRATDLGKAETGDHNLSRLNKLKEGDTVVVTVRRQNPATDEQPRFERFEVPYSKWMRVLDVLEYINEDLGSGLGYRWLCGVKKCGTCAVKMNGREVLACWEAAEPDMLIEPLDHAPLLRDLVVDRSDYEKKLMMITPWMERNNTYPGFPEALTHTEMKSANTAMHCISCMACMSACPVLDFGDLTNFAGPAVLVQLGQRALDPRDKLDRGVIAHEVCDVFSCVSCYKCEEVCPAEIPIVSGVIEPLKAMAYKARPQNARHADAFRSLLIRDGEVDPSALVLKLHGLKSFQRLGRIWKLLRHGKINPFKTFFHRKSAAADDVRKIHQIMKDE